jgi:Mlc titration factor MtfA (ptsG expression regulator)
MLDLLRRLRGTPDPIDPALWRDTCASLPWLRALDPQRLALLAILAARFRDDKTITPLQGLELDPLQHTQLASLCCLPLLRYGANGLDGWSQLLVYPDAFRVRRQQLDAAGVMHETDHALVGESWGAGPLILSWADVQADIANPHNGSCVAVHEMAHKLDTLDDVSDGTPLLPRQWQLSWARDFQHAYDAFVDDIARGRRVAIDTYAAESPVEFFAVCSEYHFSDPRRLHDAMPMVAAHLVRFYGPSPFATVSL